VASGVELAEEGKVSSLISSLEWLLSWMELPSLKEGEKVSAGQVIKGFDGADNGEKKLGRGARDGRSL
jgi:hypothetical protein